jgi:hypothetical protein
VPQPREQMLNRGRAIFDPPAVSQRQPLANARSIADLEPEILSRARR